MAILMPCKGTGNKPNKKDYLPKIGTQYKDHFNAVDRIDRYMAEIEPPFRMPELGSVHIRSLILFGVYQIYALSMECRAVGRIPLREQSHYKGIRVWLELLSEHLMMSSE